jgi:hypothetical protein
MLKIRPSRAGGLTRHPLRYALFTAFVLTFLFANVFPVSRFVGLGDNVPTALAAPPSNDFASGAINIPDGPPYPQLTASVDITDATTGGNPGAEPSFGSGNSVDRTIWYTFTPSVSTLYRVETCGGIATGTTITDTVLGVFTSPGAGGPFTRLVAADEGCPEFGRSRVQAYLNAGTTYWIAAGKFNNGIAPTAGLSSVQVAVTRLNPPSNDLYSNAAVIPAAGPFPYQTTPVDITDATTAYNPFDEPNTGGLSIERTIWYTFNPASSGAYIIQTCQQSAPGTILTDTGLAVFSGTVTMNSNPIISNGDTGCGPGGRHSSVSLYMSAGVTYSIMAGRQTPSDPPTPGFNAIQLFINALTPPANDFSTGAVTIPAAGPFPYLTASVNITDATVNSNGTFNNVADPVGLPIPNDRTVWFNFSPSITDFYRIETCSQVAPGTTVIDTVLGVFSGASANGSFGLVSANSANNDAVGCGPDGKQSAFTAELLGGSNYWIVAGRANNATSPYPTPTSNEVQVRVSKAPPTPGDNVDVAIPLTLNIPQNGTTLLTKNDYQLNAPACFTGIGQTNTAALNTGRDAVYSFEAPSTANYSFRVTGYNAPDLVLYVANALPSGAGPFTLTSECLRASNRSGSSTNAAEEVFNLPLVAGNTVYIVVDDRGAVSSPGSNFSIEATLTNYENEPNNTPGAASPIFCYTVGSINPTGDVDFYTLGTPPAGSRVFAVVDPLATSGFGNNYDLRVTSDTATLEYDDADNDTNLGANAANIAGTPTTGGPVYLRVNYGGDTTATEPYRLYSVVQGPLASAVTIAEPNNSIAQAGSAASNYYSGTITFADSDYYLVTATAGQVIHIALDGDPTRNSTPFDGRIELRDANDNLLILANDGNAASSTAAGAGLNAISPRSPGEAIIFRVAQSGMYYVRVAGTGTSATGDYLLSIAKDCTAGGVVNPTPASITATSGSGQSTSVNTTFPLPLTATVRDSANTPVAGVVVTFTAPASGASATLNGNTVYTATTNASGVATATATTNSIIGSYNVTASVGGVATPASFALTNTVGAATNIVAISGGGQSATINTVFANPLVAKVTDGTNNPLASVLVTFTAPASGASGTFAGNSLTYSAQTDAAGLVTSTVFTANGVPGSYTVTATAAGVATPASFGLTNTVGAAANIEPISGSGQSAAINTAFANPLVARVTDSANNPVASVVVTFTAPASGASGTFAGSSLTYSAQTDAAGLVTSTVFTANGVTGNYTVTATAAGVLNSASFTLTNTTDCVAPLTVTQTTDDGTGTVCGSLSRALNTLATAGGSGLTFGFAGKTTITVTGALPNVPAGVSISGGCVANEPQVVLRASGALTDALRITQNTVISGVAVVGFGGWAITIDGTNNQVNCSWLGTADGITAIPNGGGVRLSSAGSPGGGYNMLTNNLISGNTGIGVQGVQGIFNEFVGNRIGLQKDGVTRLANGQAVRFQLGFQGRFNPTNRIVS